MRIKPEYLIRGARPAKVAARKYVLFEYLSYFPVIITKKNKRNKERAGISSIRFCDGIKAGLMAKTAVKNKANFGLKCFANL